MLFFACKKKEEKLFELMPADFTGIQFENTLTSSDSLNILEYLYFYNGGGVAAGDINNDGLVDLYFTGNQVPDKLYLNKGNFEFEDISEAAGITGEPGWSTGVTMADVNGDGLLDIYVCQVGGYKGISGKNRLYINQGDGKFLDLAAQYGVDFQGFSTHAVFFDYDRDGDLDLYLLNHGVKSPEVFAKASNRGFPDESGDRLYKNRAAEGERGFVDVTLESGIHSSVLGFGLGVGVEDVNGDGWLDIYVSNDFTENDYLYLNNQDGTFTESLEELISHTSRYSMGNDLADLNGDGWPEIFTTDMLPEDPRIWMKSVGEDKPEVYRIKKQMGYGDQYVRNHLQLNQKGKGFNEIALFSAVHASDWSWSPLIFDMDNDGLADIHITNGVVKRPNDLDFIQYSQESDPNLTDAAVSRRQIELLPSMKLPNYAFQNQGELQFTNQSNPWGLDHPSYSNGSTYADLDNDGDLDLIINNLNQPAFIYKSHAEKSGNNFLRIDLQAVGLNPFGIGSKVTLHAGGNTWTQRLSGSRGFQSGPSTTLVFGLGKAASIDSITVNWPNGTSELFPQSLVNTSLVLSQGAGVELDRKEPLTAETTSFPKISWVHQENMDLDETKREYLIPRSFGQLGPAVAVADVNGDGLQDIYLGGAKGQAGALFLQNPDGSFTEKANGTFVQMAMAEDIIAEFEDFNGDGHLDLFVGSGGNEYASGEIFNADRLFLGDGAGGFSFSPMSLPPIAQNTSTVAVVDLDGDGDLDLFIGSSVVTGDYGASPRSSLLINQGNGRFVDETEKWFGPDVDFGMVNSAAWTDLDGNGKIDLVLTGDWQSIRVFGLDQEGRFSERSVSGLEYSSGWIHTLLLADINGDGRLDILTGNLGLNSKLKASREKPVWLYHHDFDQNGQADPLIFHTTGDVMIPFASRDDLIKQIPGIKRLHPSYASYAEISSPDDLFDKETLAQAAKKPVYELRSGVYLQQEDGSFSFLPFPTASQLSPIMDLIWDQENKLILTAGNFSGFRTDLGKAIADPFQAIHWTGQKWTLHTPINSIPRKSELRNIRTITVKGTVYLIAPSNNGEIYWAKLD